ncbi:MAG: UDP-N-acetylenolpyruvoylglucosamine reductase, partial [Cyclobacteriaceae bacterium]|nr:UDP-N-acetylenolpyruvoylglucosamine reductase [Cyclobacteriaceae bacterium]
ALEFETGEVRTFTKEECRFGYRESIFKNTWRDKLFISSVTLSLTKKNHRLRTSYGAIMDVLKDKKITTPSLRDITNAVISIRQSKLPDPRVLGNAGSFFKNPSIPQSQYQALLTSYPTMPGYPVENQFVKIPAAWLIEHCGWKGKRIRSAGVHQHQALVLVNYGDATGEELLYVAEQIQHDVFTQFGIQLTREVNVI